MGLPSIEEGSIIFCISYSKEDLNFIVYLSSMNRWYCLASFIKSRFWVVWSWTIELVGGSIRYFNSGDFFRNSLILWSLKPVRF